MLLAVGVGLEWGYLSLLGRPLTIVLAVLLAGFLLCAWLIKNLHWQELAYVTVPGWSLWIVWILVLPPTPLQHAAVWQRPFTALLLFPAFLPAFLLALHLQARSPFLMLWVILLISAGDVGAMTFGKLWGRRPLVRQISPGKTWEGLLGGLLASAIVGTLGGWIWLGAGLSVFLSGALLGVVTGGFAVGGDLAESYLKRRANRKDSGQLLPGHGGLLDRLDSMSAGIPVFVAGIYYLGWWK